MRFAHFPLAVCLLTVLCTTIIAKDLKVPLEVGDMAPDFKLETLEGKTITLTDTLKNGPAIVVVLRGFPGYQCPLCSRQVSSLIDSAKKFASKDATVVLVYPGPDKNLDARAREFLKETKLPDNFLLVTDPNFHFTSSYALRWNAPSETAYPSTFIIDEGRNVLFARVSKSHGGRAKTKNVLKALK